MSDSSRGASCLSLRPHIRRVVTLCVCRYWVVTRLLTGCVRLVPVYVRRVCVDLMWLGVCPFVGLFGLLRGCVEVWFGFVRFAMLLAVDTCIVLSFEAMPGLCCFLRVTRQQILLPYEHTSDRGALPRVHCHVYIPNATNLST